MKVALAFVIAFLIGEFHAEVHGKPTILGCFIRGIDGIETEVCGR